MAKLCSDCQSMGFIKEGSKLYRSKVFIPPTTADFYTLVPKSQCEDCAERRRQDDVQAEEQAKVYTWFIQHMQEIPRDEEWKQKMLDRILPPN